MRSTGKPDLIRDFTARRNEQYGAVWIRRQARLDGVGLVLLTVVPCERHASFAA